MLINDLPNTKVLYQGFTQKVDTNLWAWCVNSGYDPPSHYSRDYKGPQTGAMTDTTLCGPDWWEDDSYGGGGGGYGGASAKGCSSTAEENEFFPKPK